MQHSSFFLKLRLAAYSLTTVVCFLWVILLSCILFIQWDVSSQSERTFLMVFLGVDALTMITLPILLIAKFRTWLDGARLFFLVVCHIGIASLFAVWYPTIPCPDDTPDDRGVCQLLKVYLLISSWVPPLLLILYGVCLSVYSWRVAGRPREQSQIDGEMRGTEDGLRDPPFDVPGEFTSPVIRHSLSEDLVSWFTGKGSGDSRRGSRPKSRLEKRLPEHLF